jgi:hypothetical protein
MGDSMRKLRTTAAAATLSLIIATPAFAQQSQHSQAPGAPAQDRGMSDAMVHKVGTALRHVTTIRQDYEQRAKAANTPQQIQDLNDRAQKDMVKAIGDQGLSVQQYKQAIQMAQADTTLRQRVIAAAEQAGE